MRKRNQRFKIICQSLIIWFRYYREHSSQVKEILKYFSAASVHSSKNLLGKSTANQNAVIPKLNPRDFAAEDFSRNSQQKFSIETLSLLCLNPSERTCYQAKQIEIGLRSYNEICELPKHFIETLSRKGWCQRLDRLSVILRQGDLPLYYYFILSGKVLVSVIDREKMIAHVVVYLKRGDSFGELSLLYNTHRASTVIVVEEVNLLVFGKDDYKQLFMNGASSYQEIEFLKKISCFYRFPFDEISSSYIESVIKLSYFSSGSVLVEDSKMSNWIFVVKSGRVHVMIPVDEELLKEAEKLSNSPDKTPVQTPRKKLPVTNQATGSRSTQLMRHSMKLLDFPDLTEEEHQRVIRQKMRDYLKECESENVDNTTRVFVTQDNLQIHTGNRTSEACLLNRIGREDTGISSHVYKQLNKNYSKPQLKKMNKTSKFKVDDNQKNWKHLMASEEIISGKRTLLTDLNFEYRQYLQNLPLFKRKDIINQKFVIIQILTAGTYFGLEDKYFANQPHMKLVSDGCECYAINKEFYFQHAPDITQTYCEKRLRPYPTQEELLNQKRLWKDWTVNKVKIYEETVKQMTKKKYLSNKPNGS